jgi:hypothetical protein
MIRDDPEGRWTSVVAEAWAVAAGDERFRAVLIQRSSRANSVIGGAIEELAARAGVEFPLPMAKMHKIGGALMRGLLLQRLLDPKGMPKEFIEDAFVMFVRGMARPRSSGAARKVEP